MWTGGALTYNKPSADDTSKLQAVIILKDGETGTKTVYLPIENSGKKTDGWTTATLDLSAYAGQTMAAIALELSAAEKVEDYQLNLGRLVVTDGKSQDLNLGHTDGSLHLSCLHGEIPGGLIAHEGGDFADQLPELLDAGVFTPQDGELVLDQRVIQNVYMVHHSLSFLSAA